MEENLINNTLRIEQTIRLTRTVIELMLSKDVDAKAFLHQSASNCEETNRSMLEVIERKVKTLLERKLKEI